MISKKEWMPLIGMTIAAFVFNTSEFMPVGLLSGIAQTFSISISTAGLMITIYSWSVLLLSLPLMLIVCNYNYRKLSQNLMRYLSLLCVWTIFIQYCSQLPLSSFSAFYRGLCACGILVSCFGDCLSFSLSRKERICDEYDCYRFKHRHDFRPSLR